MADRTRKVGEDAKLELDKAFLGKRLYFFATRSQISVFALLFSYIS